MPLYKLAYSICFIQETEFNPIASSGYIMPIILSYSV